MVTVYNSNRGGGHQAVGPSPDGKGYTTYQKPDTTIPPRPLPIMDSISVNGVAIAESDILQEAQHHPAANPGEALRAAAQALVVRRLLLDEAERLGHDGSSARVEGDRRETTEDASIRELLDAEVEVPSATQAECRRFHENNASRFVSPAIHEARHILLAAMETDEEARKAAWEKAREICSLLEGDPGLFASLAKAHSACPSASQGGNLGQLTSGSTVAEFESVLNGMQEGEITRAPVATRFGYHVIALDRFIAAKELPFEAVQEKIAAWLEAQAWSRACAQYVSLLAGRATITGIDMAGSESPLVQ